MNIKYTLNHKLLSIPEMEDFKKGQERTLALMLLSMALHFTTYVGYLDYYQNQIAQDLGCNPHRLATIMNRFKKLGWVKEIRKYQRKGHIPARIVTTSTLKRYIQNGKKIYPESPQDIDQPNMVSNVNGCNTKSGDGLHPPPSSRFVSTDPKAPCDPGPQPNPASPEWFVWYQKLEEYKKAMEQKVKQK